MKSWLFAHFRAFSGACSRLAASPLANLLNIAVIGAALALPLGLYVLLANLQGLARDHTPQPQISIFMNLDANADVVRNIDQRLRQQAGVAAFRFVPRAQALSQLQARAGLGDIMAGLRDNPLPDAFIVKPKDHRVAALESLRAEFARWTGVAEVQVDSDWARRLEQLLALGRSGVLMLGAALALALIAITFNTIRLQILTQRDEIEVIRLIGATDAYVRRPFLYFGGLAGAAGGIAAWLMIGLALLLLDAQLRPLAESYGIPLQLSHLSPTDSAWALLFACGLGWCGAWLSVRRHLRLD